MIPKTTFTDQDKTMLDMARDNSYKLQKEKIIISILMLQDPKRIRDDKQLKKHNDYMNNFYLINFIIFTQIINVGKY